MNFYNDTEPYVVEWLRNLATAGHIGAGDVLTTPIQELEGWQLAGYDRCHFFAGLGGWDYALQLAGWPDDLPVWTGSCPCQPFSVAGKRKGTSDDRHLWPYFRNLIEQCRPAIIFGEQVASKDGRVWLAGVRSDLEALGYVVGAADLCAAGVGAPHIRQRLYWLAYAGCVGRAGRGGARNLASTQRVTEEQTQERERLRDAANDGCADGGLAYTKHAERRAERQEDSNAHGRDGFRRGYTDDEGPQGRREHFGEYTDKRFAWTPSELIPCLDGKARRIEPGTFPLAHGVPARVGKLRAYGNAIVPQVAAEFIRSAMDVLGIS